ncbi:phospholipase D-like domain-containing protein [Paenibacillus validus]|uniref:phospholipase D-like domain-containing protein n=1 Tax=Paenibacillus validus TaxID=44253 RepID=UPI003D28D302
MRCRIRFLTDWHFVSGYRLTDTGLFPEHECAGRKPVQILSSGPDAHWDTVLEMYFGAITTAKKRIFITTPLFYSGGQHHHGVEKRRPSAASTCASFIRRSPISRIVNYASLSFMEELMQAGVRFYAYHKGFVHAKVILIDHLLASVGTANMDMRSFYSNFEMNAVFIR